MSHKILITGGSGLVGIQLTQLLLSKGYAFAHIGRSSKAGRLPSFIWDVVNQKFDLQALQGVDTIVHLAGAGVADKRWTEKRKKEILDSRIQSTELLWKVLKEGNHSVKAIVSASAIGYYGFGMGEEIVDEESKPGTDFLAQVTKLWEQTPCAPHGRRGRRRPYQPARPRRAVPREPGRSSYSARPTWARRTSRR